MKFKIIENQYFGCVNWYSLLFNETNIELDACESWQKMSFRNRCVVAGSNGLIQLTVPLQKGRNQKAQIREIQIDNNHRWQEQHWRTIFSCYGKAPFFEFYEGWLQQFYQKRFDLLFDMNLEIVEWVKKLLKQTVPLNVRVTKLAGTEESVIDYRNRWLPKNFQQGEFVKYNQVFEDRIGFQSNLSILDLLFNEGPNTFHVLRQQNGFLQAL
ncbi:MAG: WbqC family protein [Bacteroidota bacterium]|nr:WbqC family protein [Bacteroidota bacterium]